MPLSDTGTLSRTVLSPHTPLCRRCGLWKYFFCENDKVSLPLVVRETTRRRECVGGARALGRQKLGSRADFQ